MNICVCAPSYVPSETYIRDHINRLPGNVTALIGEFPDYQIGGRLVVPPAYRLLTRFPRRLPAWVVQRARAAVNRSVVAAFKKLRTEVVLAEFGTHAIAFLEPCRLAGVPLIVHFHGNDIYSGPALAPYKTEYNRLFRDAAAMVVVSRDMFERAKRLAGSEDRIVYNSCGVDVEQFVPTDPSRNSPLFVGVGRFVNKKAPYLTITAFAETLRACPQAKLVLVGDGPLLDCCEQLSRALGIAGSVTFPGIVDHAAVRRLLTTARAFVQHSVTAANGDSEGTPVAVLEAAATALPVVSTQHGGIQDAVVQGKTGFLVAERDIHGMAQYMIRLANDPEEAAAIGRRARQHIVENFSMSSSIRNLSLILQEAAKQHRRKQAGKIGGGVQTSASESQAPGS